MEALERAVATHLALKNMEIDALREALQALVAEEVLGDIGYLDRCVFCESRWEADRSTMGRTVHAAGCPWVKARLLVYPSLPGGSTGGA